MFCTTCGKKLSDNAMFCGYCGTSVNMKHREDISAEQLQAPQPEPQQIQPQTSQPEPQQMQTQTSQVQLQVPPPITLPTPPQVSQPVQNPRVQYVARPVGAPVAGVTEAPKKKRGWIVPVILVTVVAVVGLSYLAYLVLVAYMRDAMDDVYREQYHEWNSYDYDTERPWNNQRSSRDDSENSDEAHNSEELFPSDEDSNQDGSAGENDNAQPDEPDWNAGNGSNDNYIRGDDVYAYDGAGIGYVGDIMHTYWFDFTVNNMMFCQTFQGYTAREGYQLIVLDMTIENTFDEEVPMFDTDFWIQWGEDDLDFDYSYPVSNSHDLSRDFLEERYYLDADDVVTGLLMYEVPVRYSEYMLIFEEYYEDGDVGDWFGVYLYSDVGPNIHTL